MGRRVSSLTLSLIIVSMALSGCISSKENSRDIVVDEDSDLVLPYFEKDDYRCFEHDDYERCWITYVPEKVNGSELVPLIIDLHGWSLSAFEQAKTRGFSKALVWAADNGWHPGIVGIVASRLKEQTNRPSVVIGFEGDVGKGSG